MKLGKKVLSVKGTPDRVERCPRCFGRDVRRSQEGGIIDAFMRILHQSPFRCRGCRNRFYSHAAPGELQRGRISVRNLSGGPCLQLPVQPEFSTPSSFLPSDGTDSLFPAKSETPGQDACGPSNQASGECHAAIDQTQFIAELVNAVNAAFARGQRLDRPKDRAAG